MCLTDNSNNKNKEIRLIWGLSIASVVVYINLYLVQGILPLIAETFDVDISHSTLLLSVTSFAMAFSLLFYAWLSDRVGRKPPLMISLYLLLLTDVLMIFVADFSVLVCLRLLQGVLIAAVPAIAMAYFKDELSQASMLKAGGVYIAANSIGGISGRLIGGALSLHLHWQQVIMVILAISIVGVVMVHYLLPRTQFKKPDRPRVRQRVFRAKDLNGFLVHLRDAKLRQIYLVGGLAFLVMVNQFSFIQLHLMSAPFSLGRFEVTLIFLCYLSGTWASYHSSHLIKRFGRRTLFRLSLLLMFLGSLLTLVDTGVFICLGFLVTAFGFFLIHSGCNAWVTHRAKCHRAKATSLYLCSYYLGAALGGPLLMPFWHHWGWGGVVLGSSLIMALLSLVLLRLTNNESMTVPAHASSS
ncbi:MFS transporter [Shewanella violacea]|uniref:Multidrug resistance protein, putative n=1 Tax=Shewanella violacea (strain JCM 10179 / CIP 106290 / LMG 19151 / DSS12) TaxID=637905 RepID=D4ZIL1_SHEVD|nr:MFS transporter [Shewanella violacea]BAJ01510.1 multidrug resistance protein, putative [Shewanella violacea DSS12]